MPTAASPIIGTITVAPACELAGLGRPQPTDDTSLGSLLASLSRLPELTAEEPVEANRTPCMLTQKRWPRAGAAANEAGGNLRADLVQLLADLEAEYAALAGRSFES
jgi:hypothetical protein